MCDTVSAKLSQPICMNASIKPLWTSSDSFFFSWKHIANIRSYSKETGRGQGHFSKYIDHEPKLQSLPGAQGSTVIWTGLSVSFCNIYSHLKNMRMCTSARVVYAVLCAINCKKKKKSVNLYTVFIEIHKKSKEIFCVYWIKWIQNSTNTNSAKITELRTTTAVWSK